MAGVAPHVWNGHLNSSCPNSAPPSNARPPIRSRNLRASNFGMPANQTWTEHAATAASFSQLNRATPSSSNSRPSTSAAAPPLHGCTTGRKDRIFIFGLGYVGVAIAAELKRRHWWASGTASPTAVVPTDTTIIHAAVATDRWPQVESLHVFRRFYAELLAWSGTDFATCAVCKARGKTVTVGSDESRNWAAVPVQASEWHLSRRGRLRELPQGRSGRACPRRGQ